LGVAGDECQNGGNYLIRGEENCGDCRSVRCGGGVRENSRRAGGSNGVLKLVLLLHLIHDREIGEIRSGRGG